MKKDKKQNTKYYLGNTRVFASAYVQGEEETELLPIETDKEWKIIETILKELQEEAKGENNE